MNVSRALVVMSASLLLLAAQARAADCAGYLREQAQLNAQAQTLIGKGLDERLGLEAAACKFRSEEWSIRETRHQAWCAGKDAAAIAQRVQTMKSELAACSSDLDRQRKRRAAPASPATTTAAEPQRPPRTGTAPAPPTAQATTSGQRFHFDQLSAGALAPDAFAHVGVRIVPGEGAPGVYRSEPNMVLPPGRSQVLLVAGQRTTSLTLLFDTPIRRFSLTRIGTAGGASVPTWTLQAFDSAGAIVGSTGEEHGLPPSPKRFSVDGRGIVRVTLSTDNRFGEGTWATWNSLPVAEFDFDPAPRSP